MRLSCGSFDVHTAQSQAMTGTPWLVPVPKKVIFIAIVYQIVNVIASMDCFVAVLLAMTESYCAHRNDRIILIYRFFVLD